MALTGRLFQGSLDNNSVKIKRPAGAAASTYSASKQQKMFFSSGGRCDAVCT
jgi:hypothetical protein